MKPTQEQLERVFEAAKAHVDVSSPNPDCGRSTYHRLCRSVRSAEERWEVREDGTIRELCCGGLVYLSIPVFGSKNIPDLLYRIARLLNQADSNGGS
jgi:hypothetical protein